MNGIGPLADGNVFEELGLTRSQAPEQKDELGQEDFLNLMVTQLRNQDPFKPMESGDFLGQLAQFGTVSGIDSLDASFEKLSRSLTSNQALQAATLLDREVLVATDTGALVEGREFTGAVELPFGADRVNVGIYDPTGRLVRSLELGKQPEGLVKFSWDGRSEEGEALPAGLYAVRAESTLGTVTQGVEALVAAPVRSVTLGGAAEPLSIEVEGLGKMDFSLIKQIG